MAESGRHKREDVQPRYSASTAPSEPPRKRRVDLSSCNSNLGLGQAEKDARKKSDAQGVKGKSRVQRAKDESESRAMALSEEVAKLSEALQKRKGPFKRAEAERRYHQARLSSAHRNSRVKRGKRLAPLALPKARDSHSHPLRPLRPSYSVEVGREEQLSCYDTVRALVISDADEAPQVEASQLSRTIKSTVGFYTMHQVLLPPSILKPRFPASEPFLNEKGFLSDQYTSVLYMILYKGPGDDQALAKVQQYVDVIGDYYNGKNTQVHCLGLLDCASGGTTILDLSKYAQSAQLTHRASDQDQTASRPGSSLFMKACDLFVQWEVNMQQQRNTVAIRPEQMFQQLRSAFEGETSVSTVGEPASFKPICPLVSARLLSSNVMFNRFTPPTSKIQRGEYDRVDVLNVRFAHKETDYSNHTMQELRKKAGQTTNAARDLRTFWRSRLLAKIREGDAIVESTFHEEEARMRHVMEVDYLFRFKFFEIVDIPKSQGENGEDEDEDEEKRDDERVQQLCNDIRKHLDSRASSSTLTIIVYSGHGVYSSGNFDLGDESGENTIDFITLRHELETYLQGDVLYLLDCCNSGGASTAEIEPRSLGAKDEIEGECDDSDYGRRLEVLGATDRSQETPSLGTFTFMKRVAHQLQQAVSSSSGLSIDELHARLTQDYTTDPSKTRKNHPHEKAVDPFRVNLSLGEVGSSIKLLPCYNALRPTLDHYYGEEPLRGEHEVIVIVLRHVRHNIKDIHLDLLPIICYKGRDIEYIRDLYPLEKGQDPWQLTFKSGSRHLYPEDVLGDLDYDAPYIILEAFLEHKRTYCDLTAAEHTVDRSCKREDRSSLASPPMSPNIPDTWQMAIVDWMIMSPGTLRRSHVLLSTVIVWFLLVVLDCINVFRAQGVAFGAFWRSATVLPWFWEFFIHSWPVVIPFVGWCYAELGPESDEDPEHSYPDEVKDVNGADEDAEWEDDDGDENIDNNGGGQSDEVKDDWREADGLPYSE